MASIFIDGLIVPFLVFCRVMTLMIAAPFFGFGNIPFRISIVIGGGIALALSWREIGMAPPDFPWWLAIGGEILIGAALGMVFGLIVYASRMAGEMIGQEMGFAMASIVDPETGTNVPLMGFLYEIIGILIWFGIDGHHVAIMAIHHSIEVLPPGSHTGVVLQNPSIILGLIGPLFEAGVRLAAPVFSVLILSTVGLGLLSKSVPQFNILDIGFPTRILVGLTTTGLLLPSSAQGYEHIVGWVQTSAIRLVESW